MTHQKYRNFKYPGKATPFVRAVMAVGGISPMARLLGKSKQIIWGWINRRRPLPDLNDCKKIEEHTKGLYTVKMLRPDFFENQG